MMNKPTFQQIDNAAATLRASFDAVENLLTQIDKEQAEVSKKHEGELAALVAQLSQDHSACVALVDAGHEHFVKPRTQVLHGVKVGLRKGAGGLLIEDEDRTIGLAEKHLSEEQLALVLHIKKSIVKKALNELDVKLLKKIGVEIEKAGDHVVVAVQDSDSTRRVNALLKAKARQEETPTPEPVGTAALKEGATWN
jgi:hypothetical protein